MYQVLLVDDEPAAISLEKRILGKVTKGFEVIGEAYDVDSAAGIFDRDKPEVIIVDMKMPKKSGVELIKYVMQQEDTSVICVAASGYSDFDYVHDAFSYGAFDYLLKPLDPKKVEKTFDQIKRLLDSKKKEQGAYVLGKKISDEELVKEIQQYIRKNLKGNNSILSICNAFGINQPYLSRIFKAHCNCTYNEYLTNCRVDEAKKMLEADEYLIGQIAELTGFSSQFYFSKVFKTATGCTPKEYRNLYRDFS